MYSQVKDVIKTMTINTNQLKIKVFGPLSSIQAEAAKIKTPHPIYIESEYMPNDNGNGYHFFLTVPIEQQNSRFSVQLSTTGGQST